MRLFGLRPSRVVISGTVVAMVAALAPALVASSTNAVAAAAPSSRPAVATRTIARQHSLRSLRAAAGHLPHGTNGPETPPGQGLGPDSRRSIGARSHSVRPDARALLAQAATGLPIPVVAGTNVAGPGGSKLTQSFEGLNLYQERYVAANGNQFTFEPPDQGMCVGNGMVLETINDALRVFSTSGDALSPPIDLNSFYGYPVVINRTTGVFGPELTDPSCFFDSVNQRWIHIALTLDVKPKSGALTLNNHIDIAVSKTADPLGGWVFYTFNTTDDGTHGTPSHTDCPCIGDYPHIGADRNGVYITVNQYPWSSGPGVFGTNFNGSQLYAISRKALASGAATVRVVQLQNLALTGGKHPVPGFTTIPANAPDGVFADANGGSEYFVSTTAAAETGNVAGRSDNIGFWTLSNTQSLDGGHLALTLGRAVVPSEVYAVAPLSDQKPGNVPLRDCLVTSCLAGVGPSTAEVEGAIDSSDTRPFNTWFDGTHVWATLSTAVEVSSNIHAGSAWFALDPAGTVAHQGYVAVAGNNVIYAGLATLPSGRGAMGVTLVGHDYFPTAAYAIVGSGGPGSLHVAGAGAGPQDGFCGYLFYNCGQTADPTVRPRWGDYPAAQTSGDSIFLANEYIAQTCTFAEYATDPFCGTTRGVVANWSTHVSQITP